MRSKWLLGVIATGALLVAGERAAEACGGCFTAPPPPPPSPRQPSVVTDHRMILSISQQQTTLYDELRYNGDPESFAWVLPISGTAKIGISSDGLFSTLDAMTQVTVIPPPMNCPAPPYDCSRGEAFGEAPASAGSANDRGVTVTAQETVGPYETVQLRATDPAALNDWLTSRGYAIPDDIKPVIAQYVSEHFDFLALKLVPGTGVQAMRPVRVTTEGAAAVLPLRMVAAGTGANVGVMLWTVAEGRYEPQNFPSFVIKADELEWDWTSFSSNMAALRAERTAAFGGRGWEVESSVSFPPDQVRSAVTNGYCQPYSGGYYGGGGGGGPAQSPAFVGSTCSGAQNNYEAEDGGTGPARTKEIVQAEDLATLLSGISSTVRITRTRSALAKAALDRDLVLVASADQSDLAPARKVTREKNQPTCTVYRGCESVGQAPRDQATARSDFSNDESFSCAMTNREGRGNVLLTAAAFGALALVISKRLRRK